MTETTTFGVDLTEVEDEEIREHITHSTLSDMLSEEIGIPDDGESIEVTVTAERDGELIEFEIEES